MTPVPAVILIVEPIQLNPRRKMMRPIEVYGVCFNRDTVASERHVGVVERNISTMIFCWNSNRAAQFD
jgi:hypothetical protein